MCDTIGKWNINWTSFEQRFGINNLHDLVNTPANSLLGGQEKNDFCAFYSENKQQVPPYLKIIPFGTDDCEGEIDSTIQNGDILVYLYQKTDLSNPVATLKQRGMHTELCYKGEDGKTYQTAPWRELSVPKNRLVNEMEHDYCAHVIRPVLPFLTGSDSDLIKAQVCNWRKIFNSYTFPPGDTWYLDPADFGSVDELKSIAQSLLSRSLEIAPNEQPVTCVQWTYTVLCLAINFPLSIKMLDQFAISDEMKQYWIGQLGLTQSEQQGINRIPFVPLSPIDVIQDYLDVFDDGKNVYDLLRENPVAFKMISTALAQFVTPNAGVSANVADHFTNLLNSNNSSDATVIAASMEHKFILPVTFYCKSRKPSVDANQIWFMYVGTIFHKDFVVSR